MNSSTLVPWVHLERDDSPIGFRFTLSAEKGEHTEDTVMWISTSALGSQFLALSLEDQMVELLSFSRATLQAVRDIFKASDEADLLKDHGLGGMLN